MAGIEPAHKPYCQQVRAEFQQVRPYGTTSGETIQQHPAHPGAPGGSTGHPGVTRPSAPAASRRHAQLRPHDQGYDVGRHTTAAVAVLLQEDLADEAAAEDAVPVKAQQQERRRRAVRLFQRRVDRLVRTVERAGPLLEEERLRAFEREQGFRPAPLYGPHRGANRAA